jgi:hypothetical protein
MRSNKSGQTEHFARSAIVVIASDKRKAFAQGSASDEAIQRYRETGLLR